MNREELILVANDTLDILTKGGYVNNLGQTIDISQSLSSAIQGSILYKPHEMESLILEARHRLSHQKGKASIISVTAESTLEASQRLCQKYERVACLNFASAKKPGGGFLTGSKAQEESLARASGLYPCIRQMKEMYEENQRYSSALYLDYFIYSPKVPVIKDDDGNLLTSSYDVSMITMPAVNAGVVRSQETNSLSLMDKVMMNRIRAILSVALLKGEEAIVLGAFGCGVFQNSPIQVANYFKTILNGEDYKYGFKEIIFAIYDKTPKRETYRMFYDILKE